jgi:hypothetical protein
MVENVHDTIMFTYIIKIIKRSWPIIDGIKVGDGRTRVHEVKQTFSL